MWDHRNNIADSFLNNEKICIAFNAVMHSLAKFYSFIHRVYNQIIASCIVQR